MVFVTCVVVVPVVEVPCRTSSPFAAAAGDAAAIVATAAPIEAFPASRRKERRFVLATSVEELSAGWGADAEVIDGEATVCAPTVED